MWPPHPAHVGLQHRAQVVRWHIALAGSHGGGRARTDAIVRLGTASWQLTTARDKVRNFTGDVVSEGPKSCRRRGLVVQQAAA